MSKLRISDSIRELYKWCDSHPGFTNPEMYAAFPDEKDSSLRTRKAKWEKYKKVGKWPESKDEKTDVKPDNANMDDSINTSNSPETLKQSDSFQSQPAETQESGDNKSISTGTSIDAFIRDLFEKRELLKKILDDYDQTGSLAITNFKLEKPFKTASFNLMEGTLNSFIEACKKIRISQRKAVHVALNDFIQKYDSESNQTGEVEQ